MGNVTRLKYKQLNTCSWCPNPRHVFNDHVYALCEKHLIEQRNTSKRRKERPKIGLCTRCRNTIEYGKTMCSYHLDYEQKRLSMI